jgi:hypothetical protein
MAYLLGRADLTFKRIVQRGRADNREQVLMEEGLDPTVGQAPVIDSPLGVQVLSEAPGDVPNLRRSLRCQMMDH